MRSVAIAVAALTVVTAAPATASVQAERSGRSPQAGKVRLASFGSCAALIRYGKRHARQGPGAGPPPPGPPRRPMPLEAPVPPQTDSPGAAPRAEEESSQTNVQEAGVDEPDLVKTAGSRIFAVGSGRLHAIDATGPRLLGSLPLEGWGHELLLHGDRLLVISHDQPAGLPAQVRIAPVDQGVTTLTEVDVSDPAAMRVLRTERIRGSHVSSRLTGRTARVVVWTRPRATYEPQLRSALRGWLPRRALRKRGVGRPRYRRATSCRRVLHPATYSGTDVLTVLTIDLEKGLPAVDSDAIMSGGQVVYASERSLFVATQKWTPEPASPEIAPPERSFTTIHRFSTGDPDSTTYRASGEVPGYLLNQFALSEHERTLRAASTEDPPWWEGATRTEGESFVTTLDERDGKLVQVGQVGGLGRGERIYAVRFIGPAGYVVTFRQVDPLYVIDLERPTEPRLQGELKIRGYSAYLHPLEGGLLLGVGQDATEGGAQLGTQLSLFDVSDPSQPRRLHHATIADSSSGAELDHHAFLWWAPTELAVLPLTSYGRAAFDGAVGFRVRRAEGIAEVGRAAHGDSSIERAFVVNGRLFTLSDAGLAANDLATMAEQAWIPFPAP